MRVLLVEDSERLRRSLGRGLERAGWAVDLAADGRQGLEFARAYDYDAIVLDLMLPEIPGLEVLRQLREEGRDVHVLILSAKDEVADRVAGLEHGADDYLVKPFSFDELLARLQALARRRYRSKNPQIRLGHLEIDLNAKAVTLGGEPRHLTPHEWALLEGQQYSLYVSECPRSRGVRCGRSSIGTRAKAAGACASPRRKSLSAPRRPSCTAAPTA